MSRSLVNITKYGEYELITFCSYSNTEKQVTGETKPQTKKESFLWSCGLSWRHKPFKPLPRVSRAGRTRFYEEKGSSVLLSKWQSVFNKDQEKKRLFKPITLNTWVRNFNRTAPIKHLYWGNTTVCTLDADYRGVALELASLCSRF